MKSFPLLFSLCLWCFFSFNCTKTSKEIEEDKEIEKVDSFQQTDQLKADSVEAYWKKKMDDSKEVE